MNDDLYPIINRILIFRLDHLERVLSGVKDSFESEIVSIGIEHILEELECTLVCVRRQDPNSVRQGCAFLRNYMPAVLSIKPFLTGSNADAVDETISECDLVLMLTDKLEAA